MGVKRVFTRGKSRIEVRRRWPDGTTFRRFYPNMALANEIDQKILASIVVGTWSDLQLELKHGTGGETKVGEYADRYLEIYCKARNRCWTRKRSSLAHVKRLLGDLLMRHMGMRHLHEFVAQRLREEAKAATVNRDAATLRHMFDFAVEEGALKKNPLEKMKKLKEIREDRPRVKEAQFSRLLRHLPFPVREIALFIYETGCRPSEALALKREHLDLEAKTAVLNMRKAGDNALIALTERAVEAVRGVPELPGCPYLFWNPKTGTRYQRINETFGRARRKAGLEWLQLKDLRREMGILIAESGQPLHVAQTQLGHSSIRTTETYYARYSPEFAIARAREVVETRWRKMGGADPEPTPPAETARQGARNVLDFQELRGRAWRRRPDSNR